MAAELIDRFGRVHTDLRISVTDRCNFRCQYCMPAEGMEWLDRSDQLTRRDDLTKVLQGIDAAVAAGFSPVKVNAVLMRGINHDEVLPFLRMGREKGVIVRFIEFMPLDAQGEWSEDSVVSYDEILAEAATEFEFSPIARGTSPAERFAYADGKGEFGVIASVTEPFCESCDRIRLTADGQVRNCLFALDHVDLRVLLRGGGSDDDEQGWSTSPPKSRRSVVQSPAGACTWKRRPPIWWPEVRL